LLTEWFSPAVYWVVYSHDSLVGEVAARSWRYRNHNKSYRTVSEFSDAKTVNNELISEVVKTCTSVIRLDLQD